MTNPAARRRTAVLAPAAALLLALTACGGEGGGGDRDDAGVDPAARPSAGSDAGGDDDGDDDGGTTVSESVVHPTGAADVVLDITTAGGFTTAEFQFALQPEVRVYGDGTVVVPADPANGDAPFVDQRVGRLTEVDLQSLLYRAMGDGLLGADPGYEMGGGMIVSDLPTTTVRVHADRAYTHSAYGLSFDEDGDTPARERLRAFVDDAVALATRAADETYRPESLRLLVEDAGRGRPTLTEGATWPAGAPRLAGATGCRVVDGPEVAAVVEALEAAEPGAVFADGDRSYRVTGATVLPGDGRPCDAWASF